MSREEEEASRPPIMPDGKPLGESKIIGWTADGLPIPRPNPSPPNTKTPWEGRTDEYRAKRYARAQYRSAQRKAAKRCGWWNKDGVLEHLRNGEAFSDIVEKAVRDAGNRTTIATLYGDIRQWRRADPEFDAAFKEASLLKTGVLPEDKWDLFFQAMADMDGKVELACKSIGIGQSLVYALLDPRNPKFFSQDFADRFRKEEGERAANVRSKLWRNAERGDGDPKTQLAVLETALPHLHGKKRSIEVTGGIDHRLTSALQDQRSTRARALFAGREQQALPAHEEPITVEIVGEVVREES